MSRKRPGADSKLGANNKPGADALCVSRFRFYSDQFMLDTVTGQFFRVSPPAGFIVKNLINGKKGDQLVDIVKNHFGIDRPKAIRDVEMFLAELRSVGIIEN
jgi:hypothetical protein